MAFCVIFGFGMPALAQNEPDFDSWFVNKTLRLDYNFSGNAREQHIAVDELKQLPEWHGKRHRLGMA